MNIIFWLITFFVTFFIMEFMAWFTHKYIMHGFLWSVHKDHHHKNHDSWFERNDLFFIFYAVVSMGCFYLWSYEGFWYGLPIGFGIMAYGASYFIVHDILFIKDLSFSKKQITGMLKELEEHIKYIIRISVKKKENVLEC